MARNLIVASNPAGRRKRRMSPKQRAAAIRNLKKARRARGSSRRRRTYKRRTNPSSRYSGRYYPRRRNASRRRRHAKRRNYMAARRINPIRGLRKFNATGIVKNQLIPALVAGGGAVVNDLGYSMASRYLPEQFQTGIFRHLGKAATAILLGYVASMVVGRRLGDQLSAGALAVVGYNVVKEGVTRFAPDLGARLGMYLPMDGLGYPGAGWSPQWGGVNNTMGMYLQPLNGLRGGVSQAGSGVEQGSQLTQTDSPYRRAASAYAADAGGPASDY